MIQATIYGGSAILSGEIDESLLIKHLTFRKFNYKEQQYQNICAAGKTVRDGKSFYFVPRYYPARAGIPYDFVCSPGYQMPQMRLMKKLGWEGAPDQENFVDSLHRKAERNGLGGFGVAGCGCGKTLMGSELCRRIGRSSMIVVPRGDLLEQWREEIQKSFLVGDSPPQVGIYQQKLKDDGRKYPFVIATMQSLERENRETFFNSFGTVIFDECQHLPAETLASRILPCIKSRFIFGLTAELYRTDNLQKMFSDLLGNVLYEMKTDSVDLVYLISYQMDCFKGIYPGANKMQVASALTKCHDRNVRLCRIIRHYYDEGRNMLVFSEKREHLSLMIDACVKFFNISREKMAYYIGGMKQADLSSALKVPITFCTYKMGGEGMNAPEKDFLLCATPPPANTRQVIGRITRKFPNKKPPIAVSIVDRKLYRVGQRTLNAFLRHGLKHHFGGHL